MSRDCVLFAAKEHFSFFFVMRFTLKSVYSEYTIHRNLLRLKPIELGFIYMVRKTSEISPHIRLSNPLS